MLRPSIARLLFLPLTLLLAAPAPAADPEPLRVRPLSEVAVYPEREAFASAVAVNDSRIAAEVSARIVEIPPGVGQVVARGAVLLRLEARDFELALSRAEAAVASAEARRALAASQLERARSLTAGNFISREVLNQRETELAGADADLRAARVGVAEARRALDKTVLRAPFRAIVRERLAGVGETAAPGTPLLRIIDAERLELSAQVQPALLEELKAAKALHFVGPAGRFPVTLARVTPALDGKERTQELRLAFGAAAPPPGTPGRLAWTSPRPHLPADLVLRRDGKLGVFLAEGGKARFLPLPLAEEGRPAPVDLPLDTPLVALGQARLRAGDTLNAAR